MRNWILVASADHAGRGVQGSFAQSCHGKAGPIGRMRGGDGIAVYAPSTAFKDGSRLQSFVALGFVRPGEAYHVDMEPGFRPFRRDVNWLSATPAAIRPLLEKLSFTRGRTNWGGAFRFGQFEIEVRDFRLIAEAMGLRQEQV